MILGCIPDKESLGGGRGFKSLWMILVGARLGIMGIHNTTFLLNKGRNNHREGKRYFPKITQILHDRAGVRI